MRPFCLRWIARRPDLTLDEIVVAMHKRRIAGSRSAVWRFFQRHKISFKQTAGKRTEQSDVEMDCASCDVAPALRPPAKELMQLRVQ
jgi:transposase